MSDSESDGEEPAQPQQQQQQVDPDDTHAVQQVPTSLPPLPMEVVLRIRFVSAGSGSSKNSFSPSLLEGNDLEVEILLVCVYLEG